MFSRSCPASVHNGVMGPVPAYLVELELCDDDLGGGDGDRDGLAVALLANDTVDVKSVLETVDGGDLALTTLVGSAHDHDLVLVLFSIRRAGGAVRGSIRLFGRGCFARCASHGAPC